MATRGESPYFMSDDLFTVTWSTAFWPYVTFYPLSDQGGMTIGSSLGDTGESNLLDTFAAPGSSQPFVIVGARGASDLDDAGARLCWASVSPIAPDRRYASIHRVATSKRTPLVYAAALIEAPTLSMISPI